MDTMLRAADQPRFQSCGPRAEIIHRRSTQNSLMIADQRCCSHRTNPRIGHVFNWILSRVRQSYSSPKVHGNRKSDAVEDHLLCPSASSASMTTTTHFRSETHPLRMRRHQRIISINVSGLSFEISSGLLTRHPTTLLGDERKRRGYFDHHRREYFFDRHRPSFEAIFSYYQYGGKIRRPGQVPSDVFLSELEFYELEPGVVEDYKLSEGYTTDEIVVPVNKTLRKLWMLFEHPDTSWLAYSIAVISVIVTLVSIVVFCVETLDQFASSHCVKGDTPNFLDAFFVIETVCTAWFTVEVAVRFVASPSKLAFWKGFTNLVDFTAILPYYVTLFNVLSTMNCEGAKSSACLAFLRVIRLVRIFKLTKHSVGLQVLILTIRASIEELGLFLVVLLVCVLVYSSAIYYAELGLPDSMIHSIPDGFWWAIITMTTVGYGDKIPVGVAGKVIGAACAITGVLALAIPIPIITGNFNKFYSHKTGRGKHI